MIDIAFTSLFLGRHCCCFVDIKNKIALSRVRLSRHFSCRCSKRRKDCIKCLGGIDIIVLLKEKHEIEFIVRSEYQEEELIIRTSGQTSGINRRYD